MSTTLCTSGAAIIKAGANISTSINGLTDPNNVSVGAVDSWINQAEAFISSNTRYDWVTNYASLDANNKKILEEAASSLAAMYCINYDLSGYTSRIEAETMLDVLRDTVMRCLSLLRDKKTEEFIK